MVRRLIVCAVRCEVNDGVPLFSLARCAVRARLVVSIQSL
uniref:Uncharacterized protein n=1 Tax=Arundo donax TaxID=35708 RepID=A0A0A9B603_ARUDO